MEELPIHFDVNDHHLSLETFVKTSRSIEKVIYGISEKIFDQKPEIQVLVLPAKGGTFYEVLGLVLGGTWAFTQSDFGKSFIKELTGRDPSEWGKEAATALKEATKKFLEKDTDQLRQAGIKIKDFPKAFSGRSHFYNSCLEDREIKGIEFSKEGRFLIKTSDFIKYIEKDHKQKLPTEKKLHRLAIVAPVTKKRKKSKLKWQAEDVENKNLLKFLMKDEDFKAKFLVGGEYTLKQTKNGDDVIIGLFEYEKVEINGEVKVIGPVVARKIYQFNDKEIAPVPEDLKIELIEKFETIKGKTNNDEKVVFDDMAPSLFSDLI